MPVAVLITRHVRGDWGDLDYDEKLLNERALAYRQRVVSAYFVGPVEVHIVTEADRRRTLLFLSDEAYLFAKPAPPRDKKAHGKNSVGVKANLLNGSAQNITRRAGRSARSPCPSTP